MIKILHLYPYINISCGVSKSIYSIITNTKDITQSYVFCFGGDGIEKYKKANINIEVSNVKRRGLIQDFLLFFDLLTFIKKNGIQILHSHHRYFDLLAFIISKVISIRTLTSVRSKVTGKKLLSYKSPTLIACSNAIKKHLTNYFKIDLQRIEVIYNFVDPTQIIITEGKDDLKSQFGIDENSTLIGFVGRFSIKEKGVDILLESFKNLAQIKKNVLLLLIGDGEDKGYIENFISKNGLDGVVISSKENIYNYYNILDIVVLPSRVEPFGIVAIEAGIMKKAFIGSKVDGLMEIIDDGTDGILITPENVEELTQALVSLIENSELCAKLGQELYQKVTTNFTSEIVIPQYKMVYENLIE